MRGGVTRHEAAFFKSPKDIHVRAADFGDTVSHGLINNQDIDPFVLALLNPTAYATQYPNCNILNADINGDGYVNNQDIDGFVALLFGGGEQAIWVKFGWDAENRLIGWEPGAPGAAQNPQEIEFSYDYLGRRIEKRTYDWDSRQQQWETTASDVRRFVYDGWRMLLELDCPTGDCETSMDVLRQYTWGLDLAGQSGAAASAAGVVGRSSTSSLLEGAGGIGGLLAVHDTTIESGVDYVYFYDANGNVGQVIDLTAQDAPSSIKVKYEYDPYGTRFNSVTTGEYNQPFRFSTKSLDNETGLYYFGYRYYNPKLGRWMNRDPIAERGGANLYRSPNPVNVVDALGMACCPLYTGPDASIISWFEGGPGYPDMANKVTNKPPPNSFDQQDRYAVPKFLETQDFRNYLSIQASLKCCGDKIMLAPTTHIQQFVGYTNTPVGLHVQGHGELKYSAVMDSHCVSVVARARFQANVVENVGFHLLNDGCGMFPYAWAEIRYKVCCGGQVDVTFLGSIIPSQTGYIDNVAVAQHSMNAGNARTNRCNLRLFEDRPLDDDAIGRTFGSWNGTAHQSCGLSSPPPAAHYSPNEGFVWTTAP